MYEYTAGCDKQCRTLYLLWLISTILTDKKMILRTSSNYDVIQNDKQLLHELLKILNRFYYINFIVMLDSLQCMAYNRYLYSLMVSPWRGCSRIET